MFSALAAFNREFFGHLWEYARGGKWDMFTREWHFWNQRRTRGWDDTDLWNLDTTIARFILPRLKEFKRQVGHTATPGTLCWSEDEAQREAANKRWNVILDDMIAAFEVLATEFNLDKDQYKTVGKGLRLFSQFYYHLWW